MGSGTRTKNHSTADIPGPDVEAPPPLDVNLSSQFPRLAFLTTSLAFAHSCSAAEGMCHSTSSVRET